MRIYDAIDLEWSWNGDYNIGIDSDIADTSSDFLLSLRQDIHTICASVLGDWEIYPFMTAGLDEEIGKPNNQATANRIHDKLRVSIVSLGISEEDLVIRIIPVHIYRQLVVITIKATPTPWNGLGTNELLTVLLIYDTSEHLITFLEKTPA